MHSWNSSVRRNCHFTYSVLTCGLFCSLDYNSILWLFILLLDCSNLGHWQHFHIGCLSFLYAVFFLSFFSPRFSYFLAPEDTPDSWYICSVLQPGKLPFVQKLVSFIGESNYRDEVLIVNCGYCY